MLFFVQFEGAGPAPRSAPWLPSPDEWPLTGLQWHGELPHELGAPGMLQAICELSKKTHI